MAQPRLLGRDAPRVLRLLDARAERAVGRVQLLQRREHLPEGSKRETRGGEGRMDVS